MGKTETNDIERYFEWWLNDCKTFGYVDHFDRESETFVLFKPYQALRKKYFKTKLPENEVYNLQRSVEYNYDYRIVWNPKAEGIFYNNSDFSNKNDPPVMIYKDTLFHASPSMEFEGRCVSLVDVKPPGDAARFSGALTSYATFPIKQAILLWLYGVYINKIVPIPMSGAGHNVSLFPNSFTPRRYFIQDKAGGNRKINFKISTIDVYVKSRQNQINRVNNIIKTIEDKNAKQTDLFGGDVRKL